MIIEINNQNISKTLKNIALSLNRAALFRKKITLNSKKINPRYLDELFWLENIVAAFNIKNSKERYSFIYDVMCDYLDNEFITKNHCGFVDNVCVGVKYESEYGCCYGPSRGLCEQMKDHRCSIKSLSCKLVVCSELKSKGIKYKINKLPLLRLFFNPIQKYFLLFSIMKDKEETIKILLKYKIKIVYY